MGSNFLQLRLEGEVASFLNLDVGANFISGLFDCWYKCDNSDKNLKTFRSLTRAQGSVWQLAVRYWLLTCWLFQLACLTC